jgi:hypothetical protein
MKKLSLYVQRLLIGVWIGQMVYVAAILAPRVFRVLERPDAAQLQNTLFPVYYAWGSALGLVVLLLSLVSRDRMRSVFAWNYWVPIVLLIFSCSAFVYGGWVLSPKIAELSAQGLGQSPEFQHLHQWSVQINAAVLFVLLFLFALL